MASILPHRFPLAEEAQAGRRGRAPPSVVVVDWNVTRTSPIGSSVLELLAGLHDRFRFLVVAAYFENPSPDTIEHVRVRLPRVPRFVKEFCWPTVAGLGLRRGRLGRLPGVVTRATQGQFAGAHIVCAHFCHRAYLSEYFAKAGTSGLRRISRFVVHRHGAHLERRAFRRARVISVPLWGWPARSSGRTPSPAGRSTLFRTPSILPGSPARNFDRPAARAPLDFRPHDVVFVFVALGDFGRKGLEIGIRGLPRPRRAMHASSWSGARRARSLCFRGSPRSSGSPTTSASSGCNGTSAQSVAVGRLPLSTIYEAASKAVLQAAAAALPIIAPRINGIEDVIERGVNGWFSEQNTEGFAEAIRTSLASRDALPEMGEQARLAVAGNDTRFHVQHWDKLLTHVLRDGDAGGNG